MGTMGTALMPMSAVMRMASTLEQMMVTADRITTPSVRTFTVKPGPGFSQFLAGGILIAWLIATDS